MIRIFSIKDIKSETYLPLFQARTNPEAIRMFAGSIKNSGTMISDYPSDFELHLLGTFDPETGVITPRELPQPLANGGSLKIAEETPVTGS